MELNNFIEIIEHAKREKKRRKVAVMAAEEAHVIDAVVMAARDQIVEPIFCGNEEKIRALLAERNVQHMGTILHADSPELAAREAVRQVRTGNADFLMKGIIETSSAIKAIIDKENGILEGRLISQMSITSLPGYHKVLGVTDGGIVRDQTLENKIGILENAVTAMKKLGYEEPKVAALCAIEKENPKMPETVHAARLKELSKNGTFGKCYVEGPISFDLAMNREAAVIKGYESPVVGEPDILLMPNLVSANIFNKSLRQFGGGTTVALALGASVPMVILSRSADVMSKYTSLVVAAEMV